MLPPLPPASTLWRRVHPLLLNVLVQAIFGGYSVFTSQALRSSTVSPLVFALVRDVAAAALLMAAAWVAAQSSGSPTSPPLPSSSPSSSSAFSAAGNGGGGEERGLNREVYEMCAHVGLEETEAKGIRCSSSSSSSKGRGGGEAARRRFARSRRRLFWPDRRDGPHFALVGLFGVWGTQGLSALALSFLPATYFAMLTPLQPVAALALALAWGVEPFSASRWTSWGKLGGIFAAVGGAVAMAALAHASSAGSVVAQSKNFGAGSFFVALQVVSAGAYAVSQRQLLLRYPSPLMVTAWGYLIGAGFLALSVIPCATDSADWDIASPLVGAALAYAAVFCSAFNYWAMAYINKASSPVLLTAFNPLQGLFAAALASIFLGEAVGLPEIVGGALIAGGLSTTVACKLVEGEGGNGGSGVDSRAGEGGEELLKRGRRKGSSAREPGGLGSRGAGRGGRGHRRGRDSSSNSSCSSIGSGGGGGGGGGSDDDSEVDRGWEDPRLVVAGATSDARRGPYAPSAVSPTVRASSRLAPLLDAHVGGSSAGALSAGTGAAVGAEQ